MSRLLASILIVMFPILLAHFAGLTETSTPTPTSFIVKTFTDPANFDKTGLYIAIAAISIISVGGIAIGALVRVDPMTIIFGTVTIGLGVIFLSAIMDITIMFNILNNINNMVAILVTAPMYIAWVLALHDWIRGIG